MKAMKKVMALGLALTMVVTAVPATPVEAASTAKLSTKKVTVAVGSKRQTKNIKVTTPSTWKSVKVTASSSKKSVAKVKVSKKTVKVTAVKKGSAKVTVKVTYKKSTKKNAKTYTKKLYANVKTVGAGAKFTTAPETIVVGETASTTLKKVPSTAKATYTSDNTNVATVDTKGNVTGVATGTAIISAKTDYGKTAKFTVTVKDAKLDMTSLEATAADTLVAKFAAPVKKDNTTLTLKRGTTSVAFKETWNADCTEVTVKTDAKMTAGTYELTATDKTDATKTTSKTVNVEAQKLAEIKILNDVALTGSKTISGSAVDSMKAYVYYDALDQYGESMRSSVSIDWSSSVKVAEKNVASGKLTLERTDGKAFTYGEQIFITGVNSKTGISTSKTLTVGAKQAVNSVEMAGFIKKGTTDILKALPKDFKSEAYYMVYNVLDQNGNAIDANEANIKDITFVSDTPLVIKEMVSAGKPVTIKDHEYDTVLVTPGIKVEQGGEVTVTAIANKTGNKSTLVVPVNVSEVLKSFVIGNPVDIIADGETRELTFTATDVNGNNVTNFETIAKQATFNKLQFSASEGNIKLSQKDDGTAKLEYVDKTMDWRDSQTTDGQDRLVSLTAIVVGGETNNQMISISDKARPTGVSGVNFKGAYVEGAEDTIYLTKAGLKLQSDGVTYKYDKDAHKDNAYISYVDQYGRKLDDEKAYDFFEAGKAGAQILQGTDFAGYTFGVMATYTGNDNTVLSGDFVNKEVFMTKDSTDAEWFAAGKKVVSAASGEGFKFAVTKLKNGDGYTSLDRAKNFDYTVVDITKVQGLTVKDTGKVYANTHYSGSDYYSGRSDEGLEANIPASHKVEVKVSGTYAGKEVSVPAEYYTYTGEKIIAAAAGDKVFTISGGKIVAGELYNFKGTNINVPRKDAEDILHVTVNKLYSNGATVTDGAIGTKFTTPKKYTTLNKNVLISDEAPVGTTLVANSETAVLNPGHTKITINKDTKYNNKTLFALKDQYGKDFAGMTYVVKDPTEVAAYADYNFSVDGNAKDEVIVTGAERADIFTVVASYKKLNASIKVTVGADKEAYIDKDGNSYLETLVSKKVDGVDGLEAQRQAGLK